MLMSSLITIVDGYFAGNYIGSQALAAINLGLPVLYLYLAVGLMIGVGAVFAVCLFFGGHIYCSFFVQEDAVIKMVSRWFKLFALEFLLQGFNVTGSMYFTAMAKPKQSAVIAMLRGIVILLVTIFVFTSLWGIDEVRELFAASNKADAGLFSFNGNEHEGNSQDACYGADLQFTVGCSSRIRSRNNYYSFVHKAHCLGLPSEEAQYSYGHIYKA